MTSELVLKPITEEKRQYISVVHIEITALF